MTSNCFFRLSLIVPMFVTLAGCQPVAESDVTRYLDLPTEERILRTLADENYNGRDELDMHFVLSAESIEAAEEVATRLKEDERTTKANAYTFPPHRGAVVVGETSPIVVNRDSLAAFRSRLEKAAAPSGAILASWGVQIYMAPRQDIDWEKIKRRNKVRKIRNTFKLMNAMLKKLLEKAKNANVNAGNTGQFEKDVGDMARKVYWWKLDIMGLLPAFYLKDFDEWYWSLIMLCVALQELEDLLSPPPPGNPADFTRWKEKIRDKLDEIKGWIDDIQEMLQEAIDASPPDVGGIPHPLTQHLRDLKAQLERKKQMIDRTLPLFAASATPGQADPQVIRNLLKKCRDEKDWFIADLTNPPANQFTLFGVSFYQWFHTLKLFDLALDRIIEFKFRDPTDANKTKADLDRLKQAISEAKALKEIMEKWKFRY